MGNSERGGQQGTGAVVDQYRFLAFQNAGYFVSLSQDFTARVITSSSFQNFSPIFARTVTLAMNTGNGAGTRRIRVRLRGRNQFAEPVDEIVDSLPQTGTSTLFKVESKNVYAQLPAIEVLSGSVGIAGTPNDDWSVGYVTAPTGNDVNGVLHARTIYWGIPFRLQGQRFDTTAGSEGWRCDEGDIVLCMGTILPGVASTNFIPNLGGLGEDPRDLRFDSQKNAIRWIANFIDFSAVAPFIELLVRRLPGV